MSKLSDLYLDPPKDACKRCDGCGKIADSDEGEPWWTWQDLPFPSNLAVLIGGVQPIPCPACNGTGKEAQP